MDYENALYNVPHTSENLLQKIQDLGTTGKSLTWIELFISERKQNAVVNGEESIRADVISGVPQGSVLGLILFACYISDIPDITFNNVKIFTDDIKLFADVSLDWTIDEIENDIIRHVEWANKWQLSYNTRKCKLMHVGTYNPGKEYVMIRDEVDTILAITAVESDAKSILITNQNWTSIYFLWRKVSYIRSAILILLSWERRCGGV